MSGPNVFFYFTDEVFPIAIDNKTEEEIAIYRNTTLGFSKIVAEPVMNKILKMLDSLPVPTNNNKYDQNILKNSVDKDIPKLFLDQFESLVKEFSDIFLNQEEI